MALVAAPGSAERLGWEKVGGAEHAVNASFGQVWQATRGGQPLSVNTLSTLGPPAQVPARQVEVPIIGAQPFLQRRPAMRWSPGAR